MSAFAFDEVIVTYDGVVVQGFGENSAIEITTNNEEWNNRKMVDGSIVSGKILAEDANTSIVLRWNSPSNRLFEQAANTRKTAVLTVRLPDGSRYEGPRTRVQKRPDKAISTDMGDKTWLLFSEKQRSLESAGETS